MILYYKFTKYFLEKFNSSRQFSLLMKNQYPANKADPLRNSKTGVFPFRRNSPVSSVFVLLIAIHIIFSFASGVSAEEKIVKVGIYGNKPLAYIDNKGKASGFYIDVLKFIAAKEHWELEYFQCPWLECLDKLERGTIDLLPVIAYSAERANTFDFTRETFLTNWGQIYTQKGSDIHSILDLQGKTIAVLEKDIYFEGFLAMTKSFGINCSFIKVAEYSDILQALSDKSVDAGVVSRLFGKVHEKDYDVSPSTIIFKPTELRFALTKDRSPELAASLDAWLVTLKNDKTSVYYQSQDRWLGGGSKWETPKWLTWALFIFGGVAVLLTAANYMLRNEVKKRTHELSAINKNLRKEISERINAEENTEKRIEFEKTIAKISSRFVGIHNMDDSINASLSDIGMLGNADRAYLFLLKNDDLMDNTHEWCAKGVRPEIENLQNLPTETFLWLINKLKNGESINIENVSKLPEEAASIRDTLQRQDIKSALLFPLNVKGELKGFIGFDSIKETGVWSDDDVALLRVFAEIISSAFERIKAESELVESEQKLRVLFENATDGFLLADIENNKFHSGNAMISKMLGYSLDELKGMGIADIHPEKDLPYVLDQFNKQAKGEITLAKDIPVKRKDGSVFFADINASAIQGKYVLGIFRDITERKVHEEALLESEARFKKISQEFNALLDAIPDSITLQSRDLKVIWSNKTANSRTPEHLSDIQGAFCYHRWHGRTEPCAECPVLRSFTSGEEARVIIETPDARVWDVRTVPIRSDNGEIDNVIEVSRDITEHRKLEEQLLQSQKMDAVGQLAGGIAHDFNNILTAIIGYGQIIHMKMAADDPLTIHVRQILESAERAADLTRRLLAFSRKQIISLNPIDLNHTVARIGKLLSRLIGEDIELQISLAEKDCFVMADSGQMEQVLMNLATNARDAMPSGGLLTISTDIVQIDEAFMAAHNLMKAERYAVLTVADTGNGMSEEMKEKIFEPFFTTKEVGKGTGLGLSVVYGVITQHNGAITVDSEEEKGTTFRIYLPAIKPAVKDEKHETEIVTVSTRGSETILIAEDDTPLRNLAKTILESAGYRVITAKDGVDAINKFMENRDSISMVLLDVIMPLKNGRDVYREMKSVVPDIKALFMSGYTADLIHKKGLLDKGIEFLMKPVSPAELLRKTRAVLDKPSS